MPVIPGTWETEAGELLQPRKQKLWWAKIAPWYTSLDDKSKIPSEKKKKEEEEEEKYEEIVRTKGLVSEFWVLTHDTKNL